MTDRLWLEINKLKSSVEARAALESAAIDSGVVELTSQRTCLSCLANCPTNMLPCGPHQHAICEDCIRQSGQQDDQQSLITIRNCPLGCRFTILHPWTIKVKPKQAGARILVLDG